jgi:hypothetical protein
MFRNRVRPPTPPLDEVTAERLLRGAPIEDLPEAYQPLGQLLADTRRPATDTELAGSAAAAAMFVTAHSAANGARRRVWSLGASALCALTLAATTGTAVAATQGALPRPIQQVAHEALGAVGISVPGIQPERDQTGNGDAHDNGNDPSTGSSSASTPKTSPATGGAAGSSGAQVENGDGSTGSGDAVETPQGVAGENPNAGAGNNSGNGNPTPGEGNQGNPNPGDGNQGGGQAEPPTTVPTNNLPDQSNGKGNGPPEAPPGQTKQ